MVEALSLIKLQNRVRERYDYDEQRVVGIILARYDIRITKEIVDQCYQYWNLDLEENLDSNYAKIREIMEFVTLECRSVHQVSSIARKLKFEHFKDIIKGVTLSDVISTAIGLAGMDVLK